MTTTWQISPEWAGETVAVLGCGPSLTREAVGAVRDHVSHVIVVNHAHRLAPWADVLVALDGHWPDEYRQFAGRRVTGIEDPDLDASYIGPRWETVTLRPGHQVEVHNSGLAAVRLAAALGAERILLIGFEPEENRRWYDDEVDTGDRPADDPYTGVAQGLVQITKQLAEQGVTVERWETPSNPPAVAPKKGGRG